MQIHAARFALVCAAAALAATLAAPPAFARPNLYLSSDVGFNVLPSFSTSGSDNDPGTGNDPAFTDNQGNPFTFQPGGTSWTNDFKSGTGSLAGFAAGIRLGKYYRLEAEYFYRASSHNDRSNLAITGLAAGLDEIEFARLEERIGGVESHGFAVNGYRDFPVETWTPYLGFGIGFATTALDYHLLAARTDPVTDPASVSGRTTSVSTELEDTSALLQFLIGVDQAVTDSITLGLKLRYALFLSDFEDGGAFDRLRSHASRVGEQDVAFRFSSDELDFWGFGLNIKYNF